MVCRFLALGQLAAKTVEVAAQNLVLLQQGLQGYIVALNHRFDGCTSRGIGRWLSMQCINESVLQVQALTDYLAQQRAGEVLALEQLAENALDHAQRGFGVARLQFGFNRIGQRFQHQMEIAVIGGDLHRADPCSMCREKISGRAIRFRGL
ncbi:hypothetical protein D9M70_413680 [compost metagenome]